ncbi:extracellular calcium-sensing receptor-like [Pleurodeles waltl]|uniref:extracellular calcium-sensing receptor-like n=1 Tax=Pleurodeles waltl TaxID=8319 RepID=UPI0037097540
MVFAIEEINKNPTLLPNISLGFQIYDSCRMLQRALQGVFWILSGQQEPIANYRLQSSRPPSAFVGESGSTRSIVMARILGLYKYPQISFFSSSPLLSDRNQFPSFFRTIPSDDFQSRGLAELVIHFGWTWVGLLADDTDYGQQGLHILKQELAKAKACIAFSETFLTNQAERKSVHIVQVIKNSTANAIVIFCSDALLVPLMNEMVKQNVTGKLWVASEAWSTSPLLSSVKYSEILSGTIGFAIHSGEMPGYKEHLNRIYWTKSSPDIFIRMFWEEKFGCKWDTNESETAPCTKFENQSDLLVNGEPIDFRIAYNIYAAVYAIALALQDLYSCKTGEGPFLYDACAHIMDFQPWQRRADADLFFDERGNPAAVYDIVNWQKSPEGTLKPQKVGSYNVSAPPGDVLFINTSTVFWPAGKKQVPLSVCSPSCPSGSWKAVQPGQAICCHLCIPCAQGEISNQTDSIECSMCPWDQWPNEKQDKCKAKTIDFLSYGDPLGATLGAISFLLSAVPVAILGLFIHHRNTPIVRANNRFLSYLLLLSFVLCFLSSLSFIGLPNKEKCLLRQVAFGFSFALCVSCILAKTILVVIAFSATKPNSDIMRRIGSRLSYIVISVCTTIQVLISVIWLTFYTPFSDYNIHSHPGKIIIECNDGSSFAFWCMLGYLGFLASISFIVAFLARKLPDSFNEAKFITFSMLAFLSVWTSFIPAYLSTKGKYMVAMEIFAILSSSAALVFCIFVPKCYIILFRSERNTKQFLMSRGPSDSSKIRRS